MLNSSIVSYRIVKDQQNWLRVVSRPIGICTILLLRFFTFLATFVKQC